MAIDFQKKEIRNPILRMDYPTAKKFLSSIGESFYYSNEFKILMKKKIIDPIARFGIGILSSFLIANEIIIETKMDNFDPCKFTISYSMDTWKYEKGSINESGTKICLKLKEKYRMIDLKKTIEKYIFLPEIPIYIQEDKEIPAEFEKEWILSDVFDNYIKERQDFNVNSYEEHFIFETGDFQVILGSISPTSPEKRLILFDRGIYVGQIDINTPYDTILCVNSKKNLFDLNISREDVIENKKWQNFVENLFNSIFSELKKVFLENPDFNYFHLVNKIIRKRFQVTQYFNLQSTLESNPLLKSAKNNLLYPFLKNKELNFFDLSKCMDDQEINVYKTSTYDPIMETSLIRKYLSKEDIYLIDLYGIKIENKESNHVLDFLEEIFLNNGININVLDFITLGVDRK